MNDRAFNQAVFDGLTDAASTWGISVRDEVSHPVSPDKLEGEWSQLIHEFVKKRCGLIVTVGSPMADATTAAAQGSASEKFLATHSDAGKGARNLESVVFRSDQAAFLAGYLAAATSRTEKVATFGGIPIPPVISYMNGFAAGVFYYDQVNGKMVRLLGWDPKTQPGSSSAAGRTTSVPSGIPQRPCASRRSSSPGAPTSSCRLTGRAGRSARPRGRPAPGVLLIGVDSDQHFSLPQYQALWLTSVLKVFRRMVYVAMSQVVHDKFEGGVLTGTLANGGVALAPFSRPGGDRVPRPVRIRLAEIRSGIASGAISVDPARY